MWGHVAWAMALGAGATASGCDGAESPGRAPPGVRGKRELFADPTLVPTRAGERAREELALADAVADALHALGAAELAVEVRLPEGGDPGAVVVAGRAPPGRGAPEVRRLVGALVGAWSEPVIRVAWRDEAPSAAGPPGSGGGEVRGRVPLYFALVGLGASAGITLDRLRRRLGGLGYTWRR